MEVEDGEESEAIWVRLIDVKTLEGIPEQFQATLCRASACIVGDTASMFLMHHRPLADVAILQSLWLPELAKAIHGSCACRGADTAPYQPFQPFQSV